MLSAISTQRKDEALLPQTIETTEKGLTDPGKTATRIKVVLSTTKKKKKFLKSVLDEAASVLFFVLCLSPGRIVVVVVLLVDINLISRISPGLHWRHPLPVREAGSLRERQLEAVHRALEDGEHDLRDGQPAGLRGEGRGRPVVLQVGTGTGSH